MFKQRKFKIIFLFFILISCSTPKKEKPNTKSNVEPEWEILTIEISNYGMEEKIGIFPDDSCSYYRIIKDSIYFKKHGSYLRENYKFPLTNKEKSELFRLFKNVINNPVKSQNTISCYAGDNVSFSIDPYSNPAIFCDYTSIGDWKNISPSINKIYNLTFKRVDKEKLLVKN